MQLKVAVLLPNKTVQYTAWDIPGHQRRYLRLRQRQVV
jgi:hypothetical protein